MPPPRAHLYIEDIAWLGKPAAPCLPPLCLVLPFACTLLSFVLIPWVLLPSSSVVFMPKQ
jgi:hypothetical protein